jgi:hypothetical protein
LLSQLIFFVTGVDKSYVFAMSLNRGIFTKKPSDLIRRKFSIDAAIAIAGVPLRASTISKPYRFRAGNLAFTI